MSVDCENGRLVIYENATHWVTHDLPEEGSQELIVHFSKTLSYMTNLHMLVLSLWVT